MENIFLRQRVDAINNIWLSVYEHFRQRLNERYGLDVSIHRYCQLQRQPLINVKKITKNKSVGYIIFEDTKILVIKQVKRNRFLLTALPLEMAAKWYETPRISNP